MQNPLQNPPCSNQAHSVSPAALLNLRNPKQVTRHLDSVWVLLAGPSQEEEEEEKEKEEVEEEAEKGCEHSGAGQPDFLGADDVAELGFDLQEMSLELQAVALCEEREGFTPPYTPPPPGTHLLRSLPPCTILHPLYVGPSPPCTCRAAPTTHPDPLHTLERRKSTKILLSISTRFTLKMSLLFLLSVVEMVTCKAGGGFVCAPQIIP